MKSVMEELIGRTPLVRLEKIDPRIFLKLEKNNPGGSVKDRSALFMILDAERKGLLKEGGVIVEPTSGNMGIALAMIGIYKGYRVILTMPESMSFERRKVLEILGAELVLTPSGRGMKGAIEKALEIKEELKAFMPNQFENPANVISHIVTTGPEIASQMNYKIDFFVAGVGTGGTITGVGKVLKKMLNNVKIVAVEPAGAPVLSGGEPGKHGIQGIGPGFIPKILDLNLIDEIVTVTEEEAMEGMKLLAKKEGLFVGISSGANLWAALKIAERSGRKDVRIVTVAPDHGERYISIL